MFFLGGIVAGIGFLGEVRRYWRDCKLYPQTPAAEDLGWHQRIVPEDYLPIVGKWHIHDRVKILRLRRDELQLRLEVMETADRLMEAQKRLRMKTLKDPTN